MGGALGQGAVNDLEQPQRSSSELEDELADLRADYDRAAKRLADALSDNIRLRRELALLTGSHSWRITRPMREARALAARAVGALRGPLRKRVLSAAIGVYRRAPLPTPLRLAVHKIAHRLAPGAYDSLSRAVGASAPAPVIAARIAAGAQHIPEDIVANAKFRAGFRRLVRDLAAHAGPRGGFTHLIALPFFSIGGAQMVAAHFARVIAANGGCVVVVASDSPPRGEPPTQQSDVLDIDLTDYFPDADAVAREELLFATLRLVRPRVFHAINSEAAWRMLIDSGPRVRAFTRVFAAIFMFQFDWNTGEKFGYAATFLRPAICQVDALLSDNKRFIEDAIKEYGLERERAKFHAVYNSVAAVSPECFAEAKAALAQLPEKVRAAERLQVLWAGRLDAQKRPELLLQIAQRCPDIDFHVYGARVMDDLNLGAQLQKLPNVHFGGSYASAREVLGRREHHLMMFTSQWEGLPNVLIEFGALGLPIIAPTVGGVGELIDENTGYPLAERPSVEDYVNVMRVVREAPEEAVRRGANLLALTAERHSFAHFEEAVRLLPGYLA